MPGRYVYCSQEIITKCMLCSKLLAVGGAHVADSLFKRNVIIEYCKSVHYLLICPIYLSYGSDLVYRVNTVKTTYVLNYVAVHFKSAE